MKDLGQYPGILTSHLVNNNPYIFTQGEYQCAYANPNSNQHTPERSDTYSYVTIRPDAAEAMATRAGSDYASISRPKQWEVPKRNVRLDKKLGSGHFGMVMKGFLKTKHGIQVVAVKMLKGWYAGPEWLLVVVNCSIDLSLIVQFIYKVDAVDMGIVSLFFSFYSIMRFKENSSSYLTREFRVKLHLKTDIALIASRFVRYRFSRAI